MSELPNHERIWLVPFSGDEGSHTWCMDAVTEDAIEYVRADRVKQLEEALRPFKAIADAVFYLHDDGAEANADKPDHYAVWGFNSAELTYGDLRRVRALLDRDPKSNEVGE